MGSKPFFTKKGLDAGGILKIIFYKKGTVTEMNNELLRKYARLAVCSGINIQPGQKLVIGAPVECAEFTRFCVEEAYAAGAADVIINWVDDICSRQRWLHGDDSLFDTVYPWVVERNDILSAEGAGFLSIHASDPENLKGIDPDRLRRAEVANGKAQQAYMKRLMANAAPWCVVSVPIQSWANKVFPDDDDAVEKLWDAIFSAVRISKDSDPVEEWDSHCSRLAQRAGILNDYNFKYLKYKNSLGTDLTVELPENHFWTGGADTCSKKGVRFIANMPTEEIFTAPKRDGINGVLYASKPLVINGNVVDGIRFGFCDGRITDIHADKGEDILRAAIDTDDGSHYIGEIALVPYDSPISNSGILFFNTLFDENASCHFAFGEAYPSCIKGGDNMSMDELTSAGINVDSSVHEDFMVGTADMSIIGITHSGEEITVFENGNFAF